MCTEREEHPAWKAYRVAKVIVAALVLLTVAIGSWHYATDRDFNYMVAEEHITEMRQTLDQLAATTCPEKVQCLKNLYEHQINGYRKLMERWEFDKPENCPDGKAPLPHADTLERVITITVNIRKK
jgi:hypothetical protein